jgi:hypothetical protein
LEQIFFQNGGQPLVSRRTFIYVSSQHLMDLCGIQICNYSIHILVGLDFAGTHSILFLCLGTRHRGS